MQEMPTQPVGPGTYGEPAAGPTGDAAIDLALRTLDVLENKPIHEHAAVVEGVHQALQERLADEPDDDHPHDNHPHDNHPHDDHPHDNHAHDNHAHDNHVHGDHAHGDHAHGDHAHDDHPADGQG